MKIDAFNHISPQKNETYLAEVQAFFCAIRLRRDTSTSLRVPFIRGFKRLGFSGSFIKRLFLTGPKGV
jgi:hypothetical protein